MCGHCWSWIIATSKRCSIGVMVMVRLSGASDHRRRDRTLWAQWAEHLRQRQASLAIRVPSAGHIRSLSSSSDASSTRKSTSSRPRMDVVRSRRGGFGAGVLVDESITPADDAGRARRSGAAARTVWSRLPERRNVSARPPSTVWLRPQRVLQGCRRRFDHADSDPRRARRTEPWRGSVPWWLSWEG